MKFKVGDKIITKENKIYVIEKIEKDWANGIIIRENDHICWSCYPKDLKLATKSNINKIYNNRIKELEKERTRLIEELEDRL